MAAVLDGRPEGFVEGGKLVAGRPHNHVIPGYQPNRIFSVRLTRPGALWGYGAGVESRPSVSPAPLYRRPNSRSSRAELMWIIVGRPWGHVCGCSQASSWRPSSAISSCVSVLPALIAPWQAIE